MTAALATRSAPAAEAACPGIARELIDRAGVKLHEAADTHIAAFAIDWAGDAADHLHAAGMLLDPPHRYTLLRLSARLREAIGAAYGHPSGQTLDEVADAADAMAARLAGEAA